MRKLLLAAAALGGLTAMTTMNAEAAPMVLPAVGIVHVAPAQPLVSRVDYYDRDHHRWHHRHWEHDHWRYYN